MAIARTFLRDKPILILSESTSVLDPETEVNVIIEVKNLSHKATCITKTNIQLSLSICNRILELRNGSIKEVSKKDLETLNEIKILI